MGVVYFLLFSFVCNYSVALGEGFLKGKAYKRAFRRQSLQDNLLPRIHKLMSVFHIESIGGTII